MHTQRSCAARTTTSRFGMLLLPFAATACFEDRLPDKPKTLILDAGSIGGSPQEQAGSGEDASNGTANGGAGGMAGIGGGPLADAGPTEPPDASDTEPELEAGKPIPDGGDAAATDADAAHDCPPGSHIVDGSSCVECLMDTECDNGVCSENACVTCVTDRGCPKDQICLLATEAKQNRCVACLNGQAECLAGGSRSRSCVNNEWQEQTCPDGCASSGECVECAGSADCGAGSWLCVSGSCNCVGCVLDGKCYALGTARPDAKCQTCAANGNFETRSCTEGASCQPDTGSCSCDPPLTGNGEVCCNANERFEQGRCIPLRQAGEACDRADPCRPNLTCVDGTCCTSDCTGLCSTCAADGESCRAPGSDDACDIQCPASTACITYPDNPASSCTGLGACITPNDACTPTFARRGEQCGIGRECDGFGFCESVCTTEQTFCDNRCFDLQSSETNCGNCDTSCYFNSTCSSGSCSALTRLPLSDLEAGPFGFNILGKLPEVNCAGISVSVLGDINDDGRADLGIGSFGRGHIVYGSATANTVYFDFSFDRGFTLSDSRSSGQLFGVAVNGAGDVNGDGIPDFMVAQPDASPGGISKAGEVYVIFGKRDSGDIDMATFVEGGFTVEGRQVEQALSPGRAAGDVNGDKLDDLAFAASQENGVFIVFGKKSTSTVPLNNLGPAGFTIQGPPIDWNTQATDYIEYKVDGAGDVNGDGIDDLVVGTVSSELAAVVFGARPAADVDLSSLGNRGFLIRDDEGLGKRVAGVGDVNGDLLDDVIVAASDNAWVVFGRKDTSEISLNNLGQGGFKITGSITPFQLARAGNVNGDRFDDILLGDFLNGDAGAAFVVFGKANNNTVDVNALNGDGVVFDDPSTSFAIATSVAGGGDVNGDSHDDIVISTGCRDNNWGGAYVVFSVSEHD